MADKPFIAIKPLFVGLHRAHNVGDEVPAENIEPNGWQDSVARQGTKAANEAQGIAEEPASAASPAK